MAISVNTTCSCPLPAFKTSPALNGALGPLLFGVLVSLLLDGAVCAQAIAYFTAFRSKQEPWSKTFVATLVLLVLAKAFTDSMGMYNALVVHFGDFGKIVELIVAGAWWKSSTWLAVFPPFMCQVWLLYRIYQVSSKNWKITGALSVFVAAATVASMMGTASRTRFLSGDQILLLRISFPLFAYTTLATDILLTAAFIGSVLRLQPQIIHPGFRSVLARMVLISVQGCLPPTLVTLGMSISYDLRKDTVAFAAFQIILSPLYAISVLTTLLSRELPSSPPHQSKDLLSIDVRPGFEERKSSGTRAIDCSESSVEV